MRRKTKAELLLLEDLDWLTRDPRGMRTIARLMRESGYFDPPHEGSGRHLNFNAGRRHVVHTLFSAIVANWPDRLIACLEEFSQASDARSRPDAGASADPDAATGDPTDPAS